jgi:hypothetical protein
MTGRVAAAVQAALFVVLFAISGALSGVLWEGLWDAPAGVAYQDQWFLEPSGPDYSFAGTGLYVVVAVVAGILTAFALGWWWPRNELAGLAAIVVGSVLAGWVMFKVGHALGPADPHVLAVGQDDLTPIPSDLTLAGRSAYTAFPIGAMFASLYVFLIATGRGSGRRANPVETTTAG